MTALIACLGVLGLFVAGFLWLFHPHYCTSCGRPCLTRRRALACERKDIEEDR